MKRSIASVCLSGDLRQKIEAAGSANFDGMEIFENDLMLFNESPKVIKNIFDDNNLEIIALQPFRDFESMPSTKREKTFDRVERKFDLMEELGTDTLLICSNVSNHCIDDFNRTVDDFSEIADRAAKRGFKVGYEALAWGRYIRDYEEAWKIVKHVDCDNLGIILDSFHIFARSGDLSTIKDIPGNKITIIQIADAPNLDMDALQWSRHYRCFPGQGDFPLVEFMQAIINTGYDGYISHEIFNDEFRSAPPKPTAIDGMRSLLWLEEQLLISEPDTMANNSAVSLKQPPVASIKKVEFIEFAAEGGEKNKLVELLISFGFVKTHQHRSKEVSLFRLGDVNIVINEEPDSYAQHYYLLHGISVCAVAYLCENALGMSERSSYYNFAEFDVDMERGELNIPAIKGIGEELIYFVQKDKHKNFYDVDFISCEQESSVYGENFNLNVDHVSSCVSETEFLSTSLLYKALFDLEITQPLDLIDPYGIVVSRTATSKDKGIRLPFNMSRSFRASSGRFRDAHNGSGVQHIALKCDNIIEYVKNISPEYILSIPENYYDDLEARFDFDSGFVENLRRYNLMYDRSETGDFLHLYTTSINGLFFEIVQRNKYANYGEVNAQVRMAAQARFNKSEQI